MKNFEEYIKNLDYTKIPQMKIDSFSLLHKISEKENVQVIDIRFKEEHKIWNVCFIKNIPLNELPDRLDELDKNALIVTACPHKDRAIIAMHYLKCKGFDNVKYLTDGLTTLIQNLLGGNAKKIHDKLYK